MEWPKSGLFEKTPRNEKIYLRKGTWSHIRIGHPELWSCLREILETIKNPEAIHRDKTALRSYRWCQQIGKFIMVVYSIYRGRVGRVKTSYTVHNPYIEVEGLPRIWP